MEKTLEFDFPPPFEDLFIPHRYKVYYGGRGSAKSWSVARALLIQAIDKDMTILCAREIQNSINDSVHRLLREQIDQLGLAGFYDVTKNTIYRRPLYRKELGGYDNGSEFIFKGLRFNSREIKSTEGVNICWIEEGQAVSSDSWDILIPTIREPNSEIWITFNPLDESDPTYQRFVLNPPDNAYIRKVNYDENPYFPEVLRQEMEWLKSRDYQSYLHVWEGEVRKHSNALVFGGYFTVEDFETPKDARLYFGCDWGFSSDATTLVRCFIDGKRLYIDQEVWAIGCEIDNTPALFDKVEGSRKWPIKADNARPETISYMRRQGFNIKGAKKWQGSIEDGIEFLKTFDIIIHPRCQHTIDEFNHYSYKVDKQTGDVLPIIVDSYNHCLKGDTLILTAKGEKPIKDIQAGEYVYTRKGLCKVLWSGETRQNAHVYTVKAGDYEVTGTADHKVYTVNRGWVQIGDIHKGDILVCIAKQSKHTIKHGTDTQNQADVPTESISNMGLYGCIDMFGSMSMEKSLKEWLSIIKMGIVRTIRQTILNVSHKESIEESTLTQKNNWKFKKDILPKLGDWLQNGIKARKGENGTKNTQTNAILESITENQNNVSIAENSLNQKHDTTNFAPMLVKVHGEGQKELIISSVFAQNAERPLSPVNTQRQNVVLVPVQCVEDGEIESKVYDLTVEGQHEFFANGILVHNCIDALRYSLDGVIKGKGEMKINPDILAF